MSGGYLPVVAAFAGSAIGGFAMLVSAWVTQNRVNSEDRLARSSGRRQDLYKQFIDEAAKLYAHALLHDEPDVAGLARVYALIGEMRVLSSRSVVEEAEEVVRIIAETYAAPNKTLPELSETISHQTFRPLRSFSEKCRDELSTFRAPLALEASDANSARALRQRGSGLKGTHADRPAQSDDNATLETQI